MLKNIIVEILKRGEKLKSKEIAQRASLLSGGENISKELIKKTIFQELSGIVKYDSKTFEYYIIEKSESKSISKEEMIIETLKINQCEMSSIDIANFIKNKFKKYINKDEVEMIILSSLLFDVGIKDGKIIKYFHY